MPMNAIDVVRRFCGAVPRRSSAELAAFFTDDAVYHNIPVDPVRGRAQIQATLAQFVDVASEAEFEIVAIAADGSKVLTERIDRFVLGGKRIAIPVMGTFEVEPDGKISARRDYFDMQQFTRQM